VRLWTKQSRLFVAQFQEHSKAVTGLLVDVVNPHLLHSCSLDRSVISYNIKENKRCTYHLNKAAGAPRSAETLFPAEIEEQQPFFPPKLRTRNSSVLQVSRP
jgi:hypothetical protein